VEWQRASRRRRKGLLFFVNTLERHETLRGGGSRGDTPEKVSPERVAHGTRDTLKLMGGVAAGAQHTALLVLEKCSRVE
jgi:hypothetical protein